MYLRRVDYLPYIQDANLAGIITSNDSIRTVVELAAQEEAISYLKQKYNTDEEFTDTLVFDPQRSYYVGERVYLDGEAWTQKAFTANAIVVKNSKAYIALANTATDPEAKITEWFFIGNQYDLFYVKVPTDSPLFLFEAVYKLNALVFWKNSIWKCNAPTIIPSHFSDLQSAYTEKIPLNNIAPDALVNASSQYWIKESDYAVAAGVLPTDTDYWTAGDNRSQLIKQNTIYITKYRMVGRIAPRNVPANFQKDYDDAIAWLMKCADGTINAPIAAIQPKQGNRIRFGGMVKHTNYY